MRSFALRHPVLWAYLYFCYFSFFYQILIYSSGMGGTTGLRQALLMSVLWLIPLLMWPRHSRIIAAGIGVVLWLASLVGLGYWLIYGQDFSQSAIFIVFESNPAEGGEFVRSYLRWWHIIVFAAASIVPFVLWRMLPVLPLSLRSRCSYTTVFFLIAGWPFLNTLLLKQKSVETAYYHLEKRLEPVAPWNLIVGYRHYREQLADMEALLTKNRSLSSLKNFSVDVKSMPDTLVLVIGESTNRQRMGLYGYSRDTTPQLSAMRDELIVFNDVVTPRPYTIEALQQALSFADSKHPNAFFDQPTLLNIMKQAGYEITWITNQQTQTRRNTMLTTFSQMADHQVYLNNNREQNANQYDDEVIAPFQQALADPALKKMIVVHLLGTHRGYKNRYPETFEKFTDHHKVPLWVGANNLDEYNSYDNAVAYTDYVIATLIKRLREQQDKSLLVYFSDHGEEVYDTPGKPFTGRNEGAPTPAMYTVPFFTWASQALQNDHNVNQWRDYADRPFSSADVIYTLPDMIGINFDGMDRSRSLISETFAERPRWIGNPLRPQTLRDFSKIKQINMPSTALAKVAAADDHLPQMGGL